MKVEPVMLETYEESFGEMLKRKVTSRKWWAWVVAVVGAIAALALGDLTVPQFVAALVAASATYQAAEGIADHGSRV